MSKALTRLTLAALAAALCATTCAAQVANARPHAAAAQSPDAWADAWVTLAPDGDRFAVLMPGRPAAAPLRLTAGGMYVGGARYTASSADGRATFAVWSLQNPGGVMWRRLSGADTTAEGVGPESLYLDRVAEVAWELLVAPEQARLKRESERLRRAQEDYAGMDYVRDFKLNGRPAREYTVSLDKRRGPVYVCADGEHIYVAAGWGADAADPRLKRFADSFAVGATNPSLPATIQVDPLLMKPEPPREIVERAPAAIQVDPRLAPGGGLGAGGGDAGGVGVVGGVAGGVGAGAATDYGRPFRQNEVTKKAIITGKPEPGFTDAARRFNVSGLVRLRGILAATGEVTRLSVVKALPHGLTARALAAARALKFDPAQKDGRKVAQYVVLEYRFNIY